MGRYYYNKREEADDLKKISVFKLKEWGYFSGRTYGSLTWTNNWSGDKSSVSIQVIVSEYEQYLRIWYTQTNRDTEEKKDFDYKVPLVTNKCNLGGKRYWFVCPWYRNRIYCGRRVGVLYKSGDYFACRYCYDLSYTSRNENRTHRFFAFSQMITLEKKIEELKAKIKTKFYNGKPTRKYKKLIELKRRCYGYDLNKVLKKILKS